MSSARCGLRSTPSANFLCASPFRDQLEAFLAAHALLQIVPTLFEGVCDDREQRVVQLREELVAGADEYFHLIGLGSRLVEALAQIMQIERDEIDHRASGDAQNLSFFDDKRLAGIFRDDDAFQDSHRASGLFTRLPSGKILSSRDEAVKLPPC